MRTDSSPSRLADGSRAQGKGSVGLMLGFAGAAMAVFFLLLVAIGLAFLVYMLFVLKLYYY
ncbi:MAG TPA: hypothetical protein VF591_19040 [Pyrinomonadaceae bacterium]|jgi:hypothetical protein